MPTLAAYNSHTGVTNAHKPHKKLKICHRVSLALQVNEYCVQPTHSISKKLLQFFPNNSMFC